MHPFLFAVLFQGSVALASDPPWRVAEALPSAFSVVAADVNNDQRPDIVIGASAGTVLLLTTADGNFEAGIDLMPGYLARSLAAADFNSDGAIDLVLLFPLSGWIAILKGNGAGAFELAARLPVSSLQSGGLVAADFNRDGVLDLAAGQFNGVAIFPGNGDLSFQPAIESSAGSAVSAIAPADYNRDGILDVAVATPYAVFLLPGNGDGSFQVPSKVDAAFYRATYDLVTADLNLDGFPDLAAATSDGLAAWIADPEGSFQPARVFVDTSHPSPALAVADLNGDGIPDVALGNYYNGKVTILSGTGDGAFTERGRLSAKGDIFGVTIADLNADSKMDVVATSYSSSSALVAMGVGDGSFHPPIYLGACETSYFRKADLNGDGREELTVFLPMRKTALVLSLNSAVQRIAGLQEYPLDAQFADFNNDGRQDMVILTVRAVDATAGAAAVHLLYFAGRGAASFAPPVSTIVQTFPLSGSAQSPTLTVGEFTGDANPDLVIANPNARTLQVFRGKGEGTFERVSELTAITITKSLAADFDGDGLRDVAALIPGDGRTSAVIALFAGRPGGLLRESARLDACASVRFWAAGDFNGDAREDLAVLCTDGLLTLLNTGGVFQIASRLSLQELPQITSMTAGDFNGDGIEDIALSRKLNSVWGAGITLLGASSGAFLKPSAFALPPDPLALEAAAWNQHPRPGILVLSSQDASVQWTEQVLP